MKTGEKTYRRNVRRSNTQHKKAQQHSGTPQSGPRCASARPRMIRKQTGAQTKTAAMEKPLPRFGEICDEWLQCNQLRLKPSTCVKYRTIIDKHINPVLGTLSLSGITGAVIGGFSAGLIEGQGLAPKTVKDILVLLHSILEYGCRQYPEAGVSVEIPYPRTPSREMRVLSREEQKILTDYLLADLCPCKFGILLTLWTGMRIGEICALRWDHISLQDQSIRIDMSMQRLRSSANWPRKTSIMLDPPKTSTSVRTIPIGNYVTALCRRMVPKAPDAYILTGTERYMEPRLLQYYFQRYLADCGLKNVTFHTLRHTFATRCVEAGVEIKSLSEILGHANTTITLSRYVHSSMELKRENIKKLELLNMQLPPI